MKRYDHVKQILNDAVGGDFIGAHGAFWRPLNREQFIAKIVYGLPIVTLNNGAESNIVKALRGQAPFGSDLGVAGAEYPRMPVGYPPVPDDQILFIEQWITDGCPDEEFVAIV
jgi:hypothetical protein